MTIEERIDDFFHGRQFMAVAWLAMAVSAIVAATSGRMSYVDTGYGMFFDHDELLAGRPVLSAVLNVLVVTGIGLLLQLLNKVYTFVRSNTSLLGASFYMLTMANPYTSYSLSVGTAMAFVLVLGAFYLFVSYMNPKAQFSIFLTFAVVTTFTMVHWAFVLLLIVFMLGFMQMQVMRWRAIVAMLLGIITPLWIALGMGIVSPSQFMPLQLSTVWSTPQVAQLGMFLVSVIITAVVAIVLTVINLYTIIGYRHQWRVYNAFFMITGIITIVAMCLLYHDIQVFLPLLNVMLAVEVAHAYTISRGQRRYIIGLVLVAWAVVSYVGVLYS